MSNKQHMARSKPSSRRRGGRGSGKKTGPPPSSTKRYVPVAPPKGVAKLPSNVPPKSAAKPVGAVLDTQQAAVGPIPPVPAAKKTTPKYSHAAFTRTQYKRFKLAYSDSDNQRWMEQTFGDRFFYDGSINKNPHDRSAVIRRANILLCLFRLLQEKNKALNLIVIANQGDHDRISKTLKVLEKGASEDGNPVVSQTLWVKPEKDSMVELLKDQNGVITFPLEIEKTYDAIIMIDCYRKSVWSLLSKIKLPIYSIMRLFDSPFRLQKRDGDEQLWMTDFESVLAKPSPSDARIEHPHPKLLMKLLGYGGKVIQSWPDGMQGIYLFRHDCTRAEDLYNCHDYKLPVDGSWLWWQETSLIADSWFSRWSSLPGKILRYFGREPEIETVQIDPAILRLMSAMDFRSESYYGWQNMSYRLRQQLTAAEWSDFFTSFGEEGRNAVMVHLGRAYRHKMYVNRKYEASLVADPLFGKKIVTKHSYEWNRPNQLPISWPMVGGITAGLFFLFRKWMTSLARSNDTPVIPKGAQALSTMNPMIAQELPTYCLFVPLMEEGLRSYHPGIVTGGLIALEALRAFAVGGPSGLIVYSGAAVMHLVNYLLVKLKAPYWSRVLVHGCWNFLMSWPGVADDLYGPFIGGSVQEMFLKYQDQQASIGETVVDFGRPVEENCMAMLARPGRYSKLIPFVSAVGGLVLGVSALALTAKRPVTAQSLVWNEQSEDVFDGRVEPLLDTRVPCVEEASENHPIQEGNIKVVFHDPGYYGKSVIVWHRFWGPPIGAIPANTQPLIRDAISRLAAVYWAVKQRVYPYPNIRILEVGNRITFSGPREILITRMDYFNWTNDPALLVANYLDHLKETNRPAYGVMSKWIDSGHTPTPPTVTKAFIKRDEMQLRRAPIGGGCWVWDVKARPIHNVAKESLFFTGPGIFEAQRRFKDMADGLRLFAIIQTPHDKLMEVRVCYAARDQQALGQVLTRFMERLTPSKVIHALLYVNGDDSLLYVGWNVGSGRYYLMYEGDFKNFDASQGRGLLKWEYRFLYDFLLPGTPEERSHVISHLARIAAQPLCFEIREQNGAVKKIATVNCGPHRDTGGADTSLGNSLVTMLTWLDVLAHVDVIEPAASWVCKHYAASVAIHGSLLMDSLAPAKLNERIENQFLRYGLTIKMKTWLSSKASDATFLRGILVQDTANKYHWIPAPGVLLKVGKFKKDLYDIYPRSPYTGDLDMGYSRRCMKRAMKLMAYQYRHLANVPIFSAFISRWLPDPTAKIEFTVREEKEFRGYKSRTMGFDVPVIPFDPEYLVGIFARRYSVSVSQIKAFHDHIKTLDVGVVSLHPFWLRMQEVDYN